MRTYKRVRNESRCLLLSDCWKVSNCALLAIAIRGGTESTFTWGSAPESSKPWPRFGQNDLISLLCLTHETLIDNIGSKNCDRSFNALDIIHLINMSDILTVEENSEIDDPTINSHTETLNRHLGGFNLEIDAIEPDGDCAFRSVWDKPLKGHVMKHKYQHICVLWGF